MDDNATLNTAIAKKLAHKMTSEELRLAALYHVTIETFLELNRRSNAINKRPKLPWRLRITRPHRALIEGTMPNCDQKPCGTPETETKALPTLEEILSRVGAKRA